MIEVNWTNLIVFAAWALSSIVFVYAGIIYERRFRKSGLINSLYGLKKDLK